MAPWPSTVRRTALAFVALAAISALHAGEDCTPPPNETCDSPTVFSNANLPYEIVAPLGCFNDEIDRPYFDVFYRFDCTQTGTYHIHMCNSSGDTYLRVYGDGCGWSDGFEMAVADDECPGSPPSADPILSIDLVAGQHYWLEVGTWRPDPPWAPPLNSPYILTVSLEGTPPGGPAGSLPVQAEPEAQIQISRDGEDLTLSWGDSCLPDDTDYSIYQGQLDVQGEHGPVACSTGGDATHTMPLPAGNAYFLVVAHNGIVDGSYGQTSGGMQRPKGSPVCRPRFIGVCPGG